MSAYSHIFFNKKQYRLSYRLLFYVLICSSLFTLLATATQLYFQYRSDVSSIDRIFQLIEESYLNPITTAVYKINEEQLKDSLEGLIKLQYIEFVEIRELRGSNEFIITEGAIVKNSLNSALVILS